MNALIEKTGQAGVASNLAEELAVVPAIWLCGEHGQWVREGRDCPFCVYDLTGQVPEPLTR